MPQDTKTEPQAMNKPSGSLSKTGKSWQSPDGRDRERQRESTNGIEHSYLSDAIRDPKIHDGV
ncbi:hypothetical protein CFAM422_001548 [Trichoderma lentiforme]|uniref:Uncharacterized protein n=1 Tax=Trichoderma lentiforme TaxID=1567552 RepID=A0A9P5CIT1_9HYPO|nr:hypothetical protein CFAM422_001548 [Trichoderma lentiforme]